MWLVVMPQLFHCQVSFTMEGQVGPLLARGDRDLWSTGGEVIAYMTAELAAFSHYLRLFAVEAHVPRACRVNMGD